MGLWQRDLCKGLTRGVNTEEVLTGSPLEKGPSSSSSPVSASTWEMGI